MYLNENQKYALKTIKSEFKKRGNFTEETVGDIFLLVSKELTFHFEFTEDACFLTRFTMPKEHLANLPAEIFDTCEVYHVSKDAVGLEPDRFEIEDETDIALIFSALEEAKELSE